MLDKRIPLPIGYKLSTDDGRCYVITREIGRGASCIVYDAIYYDNLKEKHLVRVKECYPYTIREKRLEGEKIAESEAFDTDKEAFILSYKMNVELRNSMGLMNSTADSYEIYEKNNTFYIISTFSEGEEYSKVKEQSINSIFRRLKAIAEVISKYHNRGLLYLDIKPENIFILPETHEHIILFDFGSIIRKDKIKNSNQRISFSYGYAAPELVKGNRDLICEQTDIFSIGAIAYEKLFGNKPHIEDLSIVTEYDYRKMSFDEFGFQPLLFKKLSCFLHKTLSASTSCRYKSIDEMLEEIKVIISLSDYHAQFIVSNHIETVFHFVGRRNELSQISSRLDNEDNNVLFLSGIGGIGKTALAKQYAHEHIDEYATVVFLHYENSIKNTICSEDLSIENFSENPGEDIDSIFLRKIKTLKRVIQEQNKNGDKTLIIIDNYNDEYDPDFESIINCGAKIIVTTRNDQREFGYEQIIIDNLGNKDLYWKLFSIYNTYDYSYDERNFIYEIINYVDGHTMTVVLVSKYLKYSTDSPQGLLEKIKEKGIRGIGDEIKVRHVKDEHYYFENVRAIIDALFDISLFSEEEIEVLAGMSLLGQVKVNRRKLISLFEGINVSNAINELCYKGWLLFDEVTDKVYLHQLIMDLAYEHFIPSTSNCVHFCTGMDAFIKQKRNESLGEAVSNNYASLFHTYISRLQGNDELFVRTCLDCLEHMRILTCEEILCKQIGVAEKICCELLQRGEKADESLGDIYSLVCLREARIDMGKWDFDQKLFDCLQEKADRIVRYAKKGIECYSKASDSLGFFESKIISVADKMVQILEYWNEYDHDHIQCFLPAYDMLSRFRFELFDDLLVALKKIKKGTMSSISDECFLALTAEEDLMDWSGVLSHPGIYFGICDAKRAIALYQAINTIFDDSTGIRDCFRFHTLQAIKERERINDIYRTSMDWDNTHIFDENKCDIEFFLDCRHYKKGDISSDIKKSEELALLYSDRGNPDLAKRLMLNAQELYWDNVDSDDVDLDILISLLLNEARIYFAHDYNQFIQKVDSFVAFSKRLILDSIEENVFEISDAESICQDFITLSYCFADNEDYDRAIDLLVRASVMICHPSEAFNSSLFDCYYKAVHEHDLNEDAIGVICDCAEKIKEYIQYEPAFINYSDIVDWVLGRYVYNEVEKK